MLALCLLVGLLPAASAAEAQAGLENFTQRNTYAPGQFDDVAASDWFSENVKSVYELDLMQGVGGALFEPERAFTIAETITIACRVHATYQGTPLGDLRPGSDEPWYMPYVDYAARVGLWTEDADYTDTASRSEFVQILLGALPEEEYTSINQVPDNAIPDVKTGDPAAYGAYLFYRAGILTGTDDKGTFAPDSTIHRHEVAAILTRMVRPELRMEVTLEGGAGTKTEYMSGTDIYYAPLDEDHISTGTLTYKGETGEVMYVDNQLLLFAKEGTSLERVNSVVSAYGGEVVGQISVSNYYQVRFTSEYTIQELEALGQTLEQSSIVTDTYLNTVNEYTAQAYYPNDPYINTLLDYARGDPWNDNRTWHLRAAKVPEAWELVRSQNSNPSIKLGVIDDSIDTNHDDLNVVEIFYAGGSQWSAENYPKGAEHGTHVAGIMGAKVNNGKCVSGVALNAEVYAYSCRKNAAEENYLLDSFSRSGSVSWLLGKGCRVINMSLNYLPSTTDVYVSYEADAFEDAMRPFVERAEVNPDEDFLLVTSAGNFGDDPSDDVNYSGTWARVDDSKLKSRILVVGNATTGKNGYRRNSTSSYRGGRVDVMAPGTGIVSLLPGNDVGKNSGTSMASPMVAGIAALMWEANPNLRAEDIKRIIKETAYTKVDDSAVNMIDAESAVREAINEQDHRNKTVIFKFVDAATGGLLPASLINARIDSYTGGGGDKDLIGEIMQEDVEDGIAVLSLNYGEYRLTFTAEGYEPETIIVTVDADSYEEVQVVVMRPAGSDIGICVLHVWFLDAETRQKISLSSLLDNCDNAGFTLRDGNGKDVISCLFSELYEGKYDNAYIENEELFVTGLRSGPYLLEIWGDDETYELNREQFPFELGGYGGMFILLEKKQSEMVVDLPLIVGDVQVTTQNAADILGDGTASYDPNTCTLTLKNADISAKQPVYGSNSIPLKIRVQGKVRLASTEILGKVIYAFAGLSIEGVGNGSALEIVSDARTGGIYFNGSSTPSSLPSNVGYGIYSDNEVHLKDLRVTLGYATYGVASEKGLYVEDCTIDVDIYVPDIMFYGGRNGGTISLFDASVTNNVANQWSVCVQTSGTVLLKDSDLKLFYSADSPFSYPHTTVISAGDLQISGGSLMIAPYGFNGGAGDLIEAKKGITMYGAKIYNPEGGQVVHDSEKDIYTVRAANGSRPASVDIL